MKARRGFRGGRVSVRTLSCAKEKQAARSPRAARAGSAVEVPAAPKAPEGARPQESRRRGTERDRRKLTGCEAKRRSREG